MSERVNLFRQVRFVSHSGLPLGWKIECDALTDADWECLALMASEILPPFGAVEGVPRGGLAFAECLRRYVTTGPLLIADDVCTTGRALEDHRRGRVALGVVAFSRGRSCPGWVLPLFTAAGHIRREKLSARMPRARAPASPAPAPAREEGRE